MPGTPADTLAFARALRSRGDHAGAAELLDVALAEPLVQVPATAELALRAGLLHLERADLHADAAQLAPAEQHALAALSHFDTAGDAAGGAAACLQLGDLAWQAGRPRPAVSWWARARSLADAVGATPLGARALLAMALHTMAGGDAAVADGQLQGASDRAGVDLAGVLAADDPQAWQIAREQAEAVRAALALVQARRALAARRWPEVRLLLSATVEAARRLGEPALYVDALRLDAVLARRLGDPQSAVESLHLAQTAAERLGSLRLDALLGMELVLALCDAERWPEAAEVYNLEPPEEVADQPAVRAARLEAFAVLALQSGQLDIAGRTLAEAAQLRVTMDDAVGAARAGLLQADVALRRGDVAAATELAAVAQQAAQRAGRPDLALDGELITVRAALLLAVPMAAERAAEATQQATAHGSVAQQLTALDMLAAALLQAGDGAAAREAAQRAVDLAAVQPLPRLQARVHARLAQTLLQNSEFQEAVLAAGRAAELADAADDVQGRVRALLVGGRALGMLGRTDEAELALGHAQAAALQGHRADLAAEAAFDLANGYAAQHTWQAARHAFAAAHEHARTAGHAQLAVASLRGLALCRTQTGDLAGAQQTLAQARQLAGESGLGTEQVAIGIDAAQLAVVQGDLASARDILETLDIEQAGDLPAAVRGDGLTLLGRVRFQLGDPAASAEVLRIAVAVLRPSHQPRSLGGALLLLGQVEGALGHGQACGELLGEALVITAQHGLPEQALVRQVIERLQAQAGES